MSNVIVEPIEEYGLSKDVKSKQLFSKVGIIGCGSVGQEIGKMISQKELEVVFIDLSEEKVEQGLKNIEMSLDAEIEHWGMTPGEKRAIMSRISGYVDYKHLASCDMVIESIRSKTRERHLSERSEVFKKVEENVSQDCIIATNSNTIVITELASELEFKDRCVSLHFLTSSPSMRVIEVVRGLHTSDTVYDKVLTFIKMLGRHAIPCEESAGLISVRIFVAQLNEACEVLLEGVGAMEDIDKTMRIGLGQSLGPFEMADKLGLDKVNRWMDNLYREFGDHKYMANPIIKRLVRANHLGRITNIGFYQYDESGKKICKSPKIN